ncbi:hypothetical protein Bbelb_160630 [Branchiostoma belcheri]|nr:hypothetical protein Bbelb_160630 [Branchiostoma belcheri]
MGRKLRHVLIFLLVILKESNMPEAYCGCKPSSLCKENLGLTSIPQNLPTSISGLDLGSNRIKTLKQLFLYGNQMTSIIHPGAFENLPQLQVLDLGDNQITTIHSGTFANLLQLNDLFLYDNQITTIHSGIFANLPRLQTLELGCNQITTIRSGTFENLPQLKTLTLHDNQITSIHSGTFATLPQLQELWLNDNQITTINSGAFGNLSLFKRLELQNNNMSTIPLSVFCLFPSTIRIRLDGNPWQCDSAESTSSVGNAESADICYNATLTSRYHWFFKRTAGSSAHPAENTSKTRATITPPLAITSDKPESALFPLPFLISSFCGPVIGIVLIGTILVTVWYKRRTRHPPLGSNPGVVGSNTNTAVSVMSSGHDQRRQGHSQANIQSLTVGNPSNGQVMAALKRNAGYAGVGTAPNEQAYTEMASGHNQAGQGQSQAITEFNTNTTTVMTNGDDHQYEDIDNHRVEAGQGQCQVITESNTNTSATVMTSGHDQTGQGQSQVITESNTNTTATVMTSGHDQTGQGQSQVITESNTNATATVMTSGHDQTGQGQSQVITESNTNTTATVMTSGHDQTGQATVMTSGHDQTGQGQSQVITESNTNTTATVMTSGHDQTGKGQSQAIVESLDAENRSYGTGLTTSQLNSQYGYHKPNTTATVMTSRHDQTLKGQSQAIPESLDAENLSYGTEKRRRGRDSLTLKKVIEEDIGLGGAELSSVMRDRNLWRQYMVSPD